jgi:nucleotide-binding universal stress UspA family protein
MRALLAYDGSAGSEQAASLLLGLPLPEGTVVRVIAAAEPAFALAPVAPLAPHDLGFNQDIQDQIVAHLKSEVDQVVERLRSAGTEVDGDVVYGRPATVLVDEARRFEADVIVAGSRGHGTIATLVLGSVSAELVDHAPAPVLIARKPEATRILLAVDGAPAASRAEQLLAESPAFAAMPIPVVSVAGVVRPWHTGLAPTMHRQALDAYSKDVEEAKGRHTEIAQRAADRLRAAGHDASATMRVGDAAAEIIEEATASGSDLLVLGSRGLSGLSRLLLGSVARNVLQGTQSSVLVVRGDAGPRPD